MAAAGPTTGRREEILEAALGCFTERGFAATTMADVRRRSGASIGSIYHHFQGKEELAAAVYVDGLRDYQEGLLAALGRSRGAEGGIRGMVRHHVAWVTRNPDMARYLLSSREAEVVEATRGPLRELNRGFLGEVNGWLGPHIEAGRIRRLPRDLYHAVVLGPAQEWARLWLAGRSSTSPDAAAKDLAAVAWASLTTKG